MVHLSFVIPSNNPVRPSADADSRALRPFISFGIPAYKRPDLLKETLASIAAQTGTADTVSYEVVVCDDGGLTETRRVVESFPSEHFSYHRNDLPSGAIDNWNRCLQAARGRWVMILHEDDVLYPWYLETVIPFLRAELSAICTETIQGEKPPNLRRPTRPPKAQEYLETYFLKSAMTPFPGVLFPRELGLKLGGFDRRWGALADYEFWYRLACAGRIEVIDTVAAFYRVGAGQWTEQAWPEMLRRIHLLRLRIAREQFPDSPDLGLWYARFFTYRTARSYEKRFRDQRPSILERALGFKQIIGSWLPSGWVWAWLKNA